MPSNAWEIGALYPPDGLGNIKWSQPGGVGTMVYPQQQTSTDYFSVKPFSELSGMMACPCGHYINSPLVQREYDYTVNDSVALICCEMCGYVCWSISPFEAALSTVNIPQLVV